MSSFVIFYICSNVIVPKVVTDLHTGVLAASPAANLLYDILRQSGLASTTGFILGQTPPAVYCAA